MENDFLSLSSATNIGNRAANEDFSGHANTPNGLLYIVCDGMGGHVGGATASQMAVNSIIEFFNQEPIENIYIGLKDAIDFANAQVYSYAQENPELKGMGTTCTIVIAREPEIFIAHVGDSRIYFHTDGKLHRMTKDHSFVQGLVDQGVIPDEEAENHPRKNEILKALGIRNEVAPTVHSAPIHPKKGDKILLCSDGLNGFVNDPTIESLINTNNNNETAVNELISASINAGNGSNDNITIQLIEVINSPHESAVFPDYNPSTTLVATNPEIGQGHTTTIIEEEENNFFEKYKNILITVMSVLAVLTGIYLGWPDNDNGEKDPPKEDNNENNVIIQENTPKVDNSDYYIVKVKEGDSWGLVRERLKAEICEQGGYNENKFTLKETSEYSTKLIEWYPKGKIDKIKPYEPEIDKDKLHPGDVVRIDEEEFSDLYEEKNSEGETEEERKERKERDLKKKKEKTLDIAKNIKEEINKINDNTKEEFNNELEDQKNKLSLITIEGNYKKKIKNIESELKEINIKVTTKINAQQSESDTQNNTNKQTQYDVHIENSKIHIDNKEWDKAEKELNNAENLISGKIEYTEGKNRLKNHKDYWLLITDANDLLNDKKYKDAKDKFENAGKILNENEEWKKGKIKVDNLANKDIKMWKANEIDRNKWSLLNKISKEELFKNDQKETWRKQPKKEEKEKRIEEKFPSN